MDSTQILTFLLIAIVVEVAPGPNFALIAKNVASSGRSMAIANITGFSCAFMAHGTLSIYGVSLLLISHPDIFHGIKLAAGAYLILIGLQAVYESIRDLYTAPQISTSPRSFETPDIDLGPQPHSYTKRTFIGGWFEGFACNSINPKILIFYTLLFPSLYEPSAGLIHSFILVIIHILVNAIWFYGVAITTEKLLTHTRSSMIGTYVRIITGVTLIAFGVTFALSA